MIYSKAVGLWQPHFMALNLIPVYGSKWWTDQPTDNDPNGFYTDFTFGKGSTLAPVSTVYDQMS